MSMTTPTTSRVSDAQREAFEAWYADHYKMPKPHRRLDSDRKRHCPDLYYEIATENTAFAAWQAALASQGDVVAVSEVWDVIRKEATYAGHMKREVRAISIDDLSAILNRGEK